MIRFLNRLQPWALAVLRVVLGATMTWYGWQKLVPAGGLHRAHPLEGIDSFCHAVVRLGLPFWFGYVAFVTEFLGGLMLVAGLLTRFWGLMVLVVLLVDEVAKVTHRLGTSEQVMAQIAMALMLLVAGSGALSLDRRLGLS